MAITLNAALCGTCLVPLRSSDNGRGGTVCTCPSCRDSAPLEIVIDYMLRYMFDAARPLPQQATNATGAPIGCYRFICRL